MKSIITAVCLLSSSLTFAVGFPDMNSFNFVASTPEYLLAIASEVTAIQKIVLGNQLASGKLMKITKIGITGVRKDSTADSGAIQYRCEYQFRVDYKSVDGTQAFSYSNTEKPAMELSSCLGVTETKQH